MHNVFISYSTKDKDIAESVCEALEGSGVKCWIAPRDEIGGKSYAELIVNAIKTAEVFLLISSSSILGSEHVLSEVSIAFDEKTIILPFKIDVSQYNENYQYYLSRKHWIDAFPEPQEKLHELVETVAYLLANDDVSFNTKGDKGLIEIAERNRKDFLSQNREKRYSSCLSIEKNEYADRFHRYDCIKRIDVLNSSTGNYSSYRWIDITNVSATSTKYIYHRECGETKAHFLKMKVKSRLDSVNGTPLQVESIVEIQPNFVQIFKIHFPEELKPGESIRIFYRLDWPGELNAYFEGELSQSISLTRYLCGTKRLIFGILDCANMYDFTLKKLNHDYFEEICKEPAVPFSAKDEPEFKGMSNLELHGAMFDIADTQSDRMYRLLYKSIYEEDDLF